VATAEAESADTPQSWGAQTKADTQHCKIILLAYEQRADGSAPSGLRLGGLFSCFSDIAQGQSIAELECCLLHSCSQSGEGTLRE
jgi:hypothetical protein